MAELLPCPFCGGEAEQVDIDPMQEEYANAGGSCIQCKQCQASSAVHGDRKENLISSWNKRATKLSGEERTALAWMRQTLQDTGLKPPTFGDEMRAVLRPLFDRIIDAASPQL